MEKDDQIFLVNNTYTTTFCRLAQSAQSAIPHPCEHRERNAKASEWHFERRAHEADSGHSFNSQPRPALPATPTQRKSERVACEKRAHEAGSSDMLITPLRFGGSSFLLRSKKV